MERKNAHHCGNEFLEKCRLCGGKIILEREGTFANPVSDITRCECSKIEHPNSIEIMGNNLTIGRSRVVEKLVNK